MKELLLLVTLMAGSIICALAQFPPTDPLRRVVTTTVSSPGAVPKNIIDDKTSPYWRVREYAHEIYRKPTVKELTTVEAHADIAAPYSEFIRSAHSGITLLLKDIGCDEHNFIVNASPECRLFSIPGGGNSFSFRIETYRIKRLADLTFRDGRFILPGVLKNGVLVKLGDVPIQNVDMSSPAVRYLQEIRPAKDIEGVSEIDGLFERGVDKGGYSYRASLPVIPNTTYALRSVAYRGKVRRTIRGIPYNELDFDTRKDIVVVFRVIDVDPDGSITLVWHVLSSVDAPKIKKR